MTIVACGVSGLAAGFIGVAANWFFGIEKTAERAVTAGDVLMRMA